MTRDEIVRQLLKDGCTKVNDVVIKSVTITPMEEYVRLGLSIDKSVNGYRQNVETGEYEKGEVNVVFVSAYTISSLLRDDENAAFAANHLLQHPESLSIVLSRAKIDIIQQPVVAGTVYHNPFSSDDTQETTFDHDTIINHVVGIKLSDFGIAKLDRLADKMMGF